MMKTMTMYFGLYFQTVMLFALCEIMLMVDLTACLLSMSLFMHNLCILKYICLIHATELYMHTYYQYVGMFLNTVYIGPYQSVPYCHDWLTIYSIVSACVSGCI